VMKSFGNGRTSSKLHRALAIQAFRALSVNGLYFATISASGRCKLPISSPTDIAITWNSTQGA
jgi:hypothetical protein